MIYKTVLGLIALIYISEAVNINAASAARTLEDNIFLEKCGSCETNQCPKLTECSVGLVKDRCGCCDVCGLEEYQLCNLPDDWIPLAMGEKSGAWHGRCGKGLECRLRKDVDPILFRRQSICYCKKEGVVCASDGNTYSHCKMEAMSALSNKAIQMISSGPCKSEPKVLSISKDQAVKEGDRITLICEVRSYPMATVSWLFNRQNKEVRLPGDAEEISVSLRGGPQITHITSHLQITEVRMKHEGTYQCLAENDLGMNSGHVSLRVIPHGTNDMDSKWKPVEANNEHWFDKDGWISDDL